MWLILLLFLSIAFIIVSTSVLKWHPFLSLLAAAFGYGILSGTMSLTQVVNSINTGFGNTVGFIGIVILAGSIIGKFLEKSGGAFQLANGVLKAVGKKNVPLAMAVLGYIVSIPVFCDSAFIILSPLAKALSKQTKTTVSVAVIALSLGLILTHSIIPPTPGPVGAAGILGADLGMVILLGLPVSLVGLFFGWLFAVKIASQINIKAQVYEETSENGNKTGYQPTLAKSLLPIFLPIVLIILRTVNELPSHPLGETKISVFISFLGQPVVALLIGVLLSFTLPEKLTRNMISAQGWLGEGILGAALIIIITGCGGAFGKILQDSGIADVIKNNLSGAKSLSIFLPIIIVAALKIAQGSGTVAIITTAGIMAPLLSVLGMDTSLARAMMVVAIGSGSLIASHANDSYFWVVTQMSGMSVNEGYKLQTGGTLFTGIFTALAAWALSMIIL
jgi:gluconate:H+ symporter, GntP family